jgi:hypothetical protein
MMKTISPTRLVAKTSSGTMIEAYFPAKPTTADAPSVARKS